MTSQQDINAMSAEEREAASKKWEQQEFVKIQKYCISQGVQPKSVNQKKCQVLAPLFGVWYVESTTKGKDYWVLSGDLPTDLAESSIATNARSALRHFSMNWQLKAANLEAGLANGNAVINDRETQQKAIAELVQKAESIYAVYQDEKLWAGTGLTRD